MSTKQCIECGEDIGMYARTCPCGWQQEKIKSKPKERNWQCQFVYAGARCPLPGSMCHDVRDDKWVCCYHFWFGENLEEGKKVFDLILKNFDEIVEHRRRGVKFEIHPREVMLEKNPLRDIFKKSLQENSPKKIGGYLDLKKSGGY